MDAQLAGVRYKSSAAVRRTEGDNAGLLKGWTEDDAAEPQREVAKAWGKVFKRAATVNSVKAWLLVAAVAAEVVGIALIARVVQPVI